MTFGAATFGEDAFGEPAMRANQPAVQGTVGFAAALALAPDGLQVDAPFADFTGAATLSADGTLARQARVSFAGALHFGARGGTLAARLTTRNDALPVWCVELELFRAR